MDIIRNNPYRVLGVLANASRKEIERNKSQIKAFAKVGKTPSFPYDFENILGPIDRSEDNLNDAVSKLTFDKDKVAYGLFWFNNASFIDEETLRRLKENNIDNAISYIVLCGKASYSTYINMGVLSLLNSNWVSAAFCYVRLFESESIWSQYIQSITGNPLNMPIREAMDSFADNLIKLSSATNWLATFKNTTFNVSTRNIDCGDKLKTSKLYSVLVPKYISTITNKLDSLLAEAENINKSDASANLKMASELELSCRDLLVTLKDSLGNNDRIYIRYADEVALQILNNCIAYYNHDQDNSNRPKNILRLVRFCVRIAEGQTAKDRCKNNFDIVKEAYDNMCPQEVAQDVTYIENYLKESYSRDDIVNTNKLKDKVIEILNKLNGIKQKIGANNKYYFALSERVVIVTFNTLIDQINAATRAYDNAAQHNDYIELYRLRMLLISSKPIVAELELYPQKDTSNISYFKRNVEMFYKLYADYHVAEFNNNQTYTPTTYDSHSKVIISGVNSARTSSYSQNVSRNKESGNTNGLPNAEKCLLGIAAVIIIILVIIVSASYSDEPKIQSTNTTPPTESVESSTLTSAYNNEDNSEANVTEPYDITYYNTGDMPYRDIYGKGKYDKRTKNYLEIDNGGETDAVVFLETLDGRKIRHAYICKNEKFKMKHIPGGKYIIKIMQGNSWNAQKDDGGPIGGFMEDVSYSKSEDYDPFVYPSYSSGKWGWYSVTLYKTENGNMSTQMISKDEIF